MTADNIHQPGEPATIIAFSPAPGNATAGPNDLSRDAVLDYVQEMSVTLSYLSNAHNCGYLSALFDAAATEAGRIRSAAIRAAAAAATYEDATPQPPSVRSDTR